MSVDRAQLKCPNADRYLAKRSPRCGCVTCRLKWIEAKLDRLLDWRADTVRREEEERRAWL